MILAHSRGCNFLVLPLTKYPPVFAKTPPPYAESVTAIPLVLYILSPCPPLFTIPNLIDFYYTDHPLHHCSKYQVYQHINPLPFPHRQEESLLHSVSIQKV